MITDPLLHEHRVIIRVLICQFRAMIDLQRHGQGWQELQDRAADGPVSLRQRQGQGPSQALVDVTPQGHWLSRSVAGLFDADQHAAAMDGG